jgi:hypothetical protein
VIRAVLAACLAAGLTAAAGASAIAPASPGVVNTITYHDQAGDDPAGADITHIAISNDRRGVLTFHVAIPSRPTFTDGMRVRIMLNADDDPATGYFGMDYSLIADSLGAHIFGCSDPPACADFGELPRGSLSFTYAGGATFSISADELGGTKLFGFIVETWDGLVYTPGTGYDFRDAHWDLAPDYNWWAYDTRALYAQSFSTTPARPRAGIPLTLHLVAYSTATATPVTKGQARCTMMIAGQRLKPRSQTFADEEAFCVFDLPARSSGQRFRSTISVLTGGSRLTRSVSGRIGS